MYLGINEQKVLDFYQQNKFKIPIRRYSEYLDISQRTVYRALKKLREVKMIEENQDDVSCGDTDKSGDIDTKKQVMVKGVLTAHKSTQVVENTMCENQNDSLVRIRSMGEEKNNNLYSSLTFSSIGKDAEVVPPSPKLHYYSPTKAEVEEALKYDHEHLPFGFMMPYDPSDSLNPKVNPALKKTETNEHFPQPKQFNKESLDLELELIIYDDPFVELPEYAYVFFSKHGLNGDAVKIFKSTIKKAFSKTEKQINAGEALLRSTMQMIKKGCQTYKGTDEVYITDEQWWDDPWEYDSALRKSIESYFPFYRDDLAMFKTLAGYIEFTRQSGLHHSRADIIEEFKREYKLTEYNQYKCPKPNFTRKRL